MICNVVFKVGVDYSLIKKVFSSDISEEEFFENVVGDLKDQYSLLFNSYKHNLSSINHLIDNHNVAIIGYFTDSDVFNAASVGKYHFHFSDLDEYIDLLSLLDNKFCNNILKQKEDKIK